VSEDDWRYRNLDKPVGYRQPPKAHRFKKGKSGNPKGRPRKKDSVDLGSAMDPELAELILAEAGRSVPVRADGKAEEMSVKKAVVRSMILSALKGDLRSQTQTIKLILAAERSSLERKNPQSAIGGECAHCAALGAMTDEDLEAELMRLFESGKFKMPPGTELVFIDDDDPWHGGEPLA
jgi:hypothetical protein